MILGVEDGAKDVLEGNTLTVDEAAMLQFGQCQITLSKRETRWVRE